MLVFEVDFFSIQVNTTLLEVDFSSLQVDIPTRQIITPADKTIKNLEPLKS